MNTLACEDLAVADFNGDGKLDLVAAGRATKNWKVYLKETPRCPAGESNPRSSDRAPVWRCRA